MVLFALLQTSWLALIEQMLGCPCCFSTLFVHLRLWCLLEGLLVKVVAGLSGEEGNNAAAVNLPWSWLWVQYFIFIFVVSDVAILLWEHSLLRR